MRGFEKIHRIISKKVKKCKTKSRNSRLATKMKEIHFCNSLHIKRNFIFRQDN